MISLHLTIRLQEERLQRNELLTLKLRYHNLSPRCFKQELWQNVPQHYYLLDTTIVLQVNQSKTSPLKSTRKGTTARWCDIRRQILEFFVAQCTLVKSGAVQSGQMQCILVKSDQFENSSPLLYIFLKSCLSCCSLATLAAQQLAKQFCGVRFSVAVSRCLDRHATFWVWALNRVSFFVWIMLK